LIAVDSRTRVWVHREPVDMRKQYDSLWALATHAMKRNVFDGELFVFIGRTRRRAKVLYWDGTGLCLLQKRIERGRFIAPWERKSDEPLTLTTVELALLLQGCEWVATTRLSPPAWTPSQ
jgi:transposase